ncbi:unnamed protein product [Notodromas monacha]|uniref:Rhodanese domain-containing protein n=1 Tax=Notodromas monacha TaxID=399045 RepID=A0A7R9BYZ3_9CRUS|nr:unnamed protein product [Notodromas monacha]CAG0923931.1 unnamed protein product [Notodromas monacha]
MQFAEMIELRRVSFSVLVPDGVKDESAAPICCAGVTAYKALKQSGLRAGQTVVILGAAGGLGNYAVQYALAMGLKVVGIDKGAEKIESLKKFEGITAVDVETDDCRGKVLSLTGGLGAHAAIVFASTAKATENALTLVRTRGTVIVVGLAPDPIKVDTVTLALRMITIRGSLVGTVTDLREAMDFLAEGKIASRPQIRKFEEVNSILDELAAGKAIGRTVAIISPDEISS